MEFKIKKGDFLNVLRWSQGIAEKKSTMPILANLLLEASLGGNKGGGIIVSATDMTSAIVAMGEADIKEGGKVAIDARHFYEIVRETPEDEVTILGKGETGLEIFCGKARFRVVGMRSQDFPPLPVVSTREEVRLDQDELGEMIEKTFYAASTDEARYTLNSLYFTTIIKGEKTFLRLVATDGHRLSFAERVTDRKIDWGKGVIVPRKAIAELKKILSDGEGDIKVSLSEKNEKALLFRRGKVSLIVRLIEGEFPNYEQVIPKKSDKIVSVGRDPLIGALRRAAIMTTGEGRGVRFSFSLSRLEISARHPDLGEVSEEMEIDYRGSNFQVGFNPRYFLDLLDVLEDEKVVLELKDEVSPCVVRSEFDRGFLAMVMPMRI